MVLFLIVKFNFNTKKHFVVRIIDLFGGSIGPIRVHVHRPENFLDYDLRLNWGLAL